MIKFKFPSQIGKVICEHEAEMLKIYQKIINGYVPVISKYNCTIKIGFSWENRLRNVYSFERLPFKVGYECKIFCEIQKDGHLVRVDYSDGKGDRLVNAESNEGDVGYDLLFAVWSITRIDFWFFNKEKGVIINNDIDDIKEQMDELIELLSTTRL